MFIENLAIWKIFHSDKFCIFKTRIQSKEGSLIQFSGIKLFRLSVWYWFSEDLDISVTFKLINYNQMTWPLLLCDCLVLRGSRLKFLDIRRFRYLDYILLLLTSAIYNFPSRNRTKSAEENIILYLYWKPYELRTKLSNYLRGRRHFIFLRFSFRMCLL